METIDDVMREINSLLIDGSVTRDEFLVTTLEGEAIAAGGPQDMVRIIKEITEHDKNRVFLIKIPCGNPGTCSMGSDPYHTAYVVMGDEIFVHDSLILTIVKRVLRGGEE